MFAAIPFPLFKLKTRDDGAFIIPKKIMDAIPQNIFDKLIITLIRQYTKTVTFRLNTLTVLSQSILGLLQLHFLLGPRH